MMTSHELRLKADHGAAARASLGLFCLLFEALETLQDRVAGLGLREPGDLLEAPGGGSTSAHHPARVEGRILFLIHILFISSIENSYFKIFQLKELRVIICYNIRISLDAKPIPFDSLFSEACASWSRFETIGLELQPLEHLESQLLSFSGVTEQLRPATEAL